MNRMLTVRDCCLYADWCSERCNLIVRRIPVHCVSYVRFRAHRPSLSNHLQILLRPLTQSQVNCLTRTTVIF